MIMSHKGHVPTPAPSLTSSDVLEQLMLAKNFRNFACRLLNINIIKD